MVGPEGHRRQGGVVHPDLVPPLPGGPAGHGAALAHPRPGALRAAGGGGGARARRPRPPADRAGAGLGGGAPGAAPPAALRLRGVRLRRGRDRRPRPGQAAGRPAGHLLHGLRGHLRALPRLRLRPRGAGAADPPAEPGRGGRRHLRRVAARLGPAARPGRRRARPLHPAQRGRPHPGLPLLRLAPASRLRTRRGPAHPGPPRRRRGAAAVRAGPARRAGPEPLRHRAQERAGGAPRPAGPTGGGRADGGGAADRAGVAARGPRGGPWVPGARPVHRTPGRPRCAERGRDHLHGDRHADRAAPPGPGGAGLGGAGGGHQRAAARQRGALPHRADRRPGGPPGRGPPAVAELTVENDGVPSTTAGSPTRPAATVWPGCGRGSPPSRGRWRPGRPGRARSGWWHGCPYRRTRGRSGPARKWSRKRP